MAVAANNAIDQKLAKMYAEKVTVNLDNQSKLDPEDFWKAMQLISVTNKAFLNLTWLSSTDEYIGDFGVFNFSLLV